MRQLYLRSELAAAWHGRDPFAAAFCLAKETLDESGRVTLRAVANRRTLRVQITGRSYIAKLQQGVGWLEILKNWLLLRVPVTDATNEFRAAQRLACAQVPSIAVAGFGTRGLNPATRQSFCLCDDIPHTCTLEDTARRWPRAPPPTSQRWRTIGAVAQIARAMHAAGVNHRDFYLCHFLCGTDDALWLIDLHRAQVREHVPHRWLVKDLGSLWFSAMDAGLVKRDLLRFMRIYHGGALPRRASDWRMWRDVEKRARRLYAKGVRLGIAGPDCAT